MKQKYQVTDTKYHDPRTNHRGPGIGTLVTWYLAEETRP